MAGTFLSCDWGSTAFRLRLVMRAPFAVLDEVRAPNGIRAFDDAADRPAAYAAFLEEQIGALEARCGRLLDGLPLCMSGMITSAQGWRELPYAPVPFPLDGQGAVCSRFTLARADGAKHPVLLCSGVATADDVMRGEECEILGVFAMPEYAGARERALLLLPGTHAKHVRIAHGAMVEFRTFMTGELLEVLARHSLLRHSVVPPGEPDAGMGEAFAEGVALAERLPLSAALFQVRAHQLLHATSAAENSARLKGILIGAELHDLRARHPADLPILLCAGPAHAPWYAEGCRLLGLAERLRVIPADAAALAGARGHALLLAAQA